MKFNPAGYVMLNLGRRPEGLRLAGVLQGRPRQADARCRSTATSAARPTSPGISDDNIYVSDGYANSRIAKFDKNGNWVKSWGQSAAAARTPTRTPAVQQPAQHRDRSAEQRLRRRPRQPPHPGVRPRRQVPALHPPERAVRQDAASDARQPAGAACAGRNRALDAVHHATTPTQYLYAIDDEPGRLYKMTLDGKILGMLGESGHEMGQFNWAHGLACPSENTDLRRRHEQLARAEDLLKGGAPLRGASKIPTPKSRIPNPKSERRSVRVGDLDFGIWDRDFQLKRHAKSQAQSTCEGSV